MLERMASGGLVIVLVIFMLIQRENLRNRLIRLVGYGRLTITTKALEEAAQRISRYLLMQSIINASFGIAVCIALYFPSGKINIHYFLFFSITILVI